MIRRCLTGRLTLPIVVCATLTAAACSSGAGASGSGTGGGSGSSQQKVTLTYASYGGAFQDGESKAWLGPYQKVHPNVKIQQVTDVSAAGLLAMEKSGNVTWDVMSTGYAGASFDPSKYFDKIDCSVVPCNEFAKGIPFDGYRVPYYTWAVALSYNTKTFGSRTPAGWKDFFDTTTFPGKRVVYNVATGGTLEPALLANGVPPSQIYPVDVKRALGVYSKIKGDVIWYSEGQQCEEDIAKGEAVMGNCWNGRIYDGAKQGDPVAIQWKGAMLRVGALAIPKGSKHEAAAMQLIAYIVSAENNAKLSNYIAYGPTNAGSIDKVSPAVKRYLATSHLSDMAQLNATAQDKWVQTDGQEAQQMLQAFMVGG